MTNRELLENAVAEFIRARACWKRWHNRMSRIWLKRAIKTIRELS